VPSADELMKCIIESLIGDISSPPPTVDKEGSITVHPKMFISSTGGSKVFGFLKPDAFLSVPYDVQCHVLRALQSVFIHDVYAVASFQNGQGLQFVSLLMEVISKLLFKLEESDVNVEEGCKVASELCKLVGIVGAGGIRSHDMKSYMAMLATAQTPSSIRSSLLSTLPQLAGASLYDKLTPSWRKRTSQVLQPPPAAFFCMNGYADASSCLSLPFKAWPFVNDYQITMWIRFERLPSSGTTVSVFNMSSDVDGSGVVVSADSAGVLTLRIGDSAVMAKGGQPTTYR
jgi:hypothetical protein